MDYTDAERQGSFGKAIRLMERHERERQQLAESLAWTVDEDEAPTAPALRKSRATRPREQRVRYDRQKAFSLRLAKAITPQEEQRWKASGTLPAEIDLTLQKAVPRASVEAQLEADYRVATYLSQFSPLFLQHVLNRMGR